MFSLYCLWFWKIYYYYLFFVFLVSHLRFSFLFVLAASLLVVLPFASYFVTCCLLLFHHLLFVVCFATCCLLFYCLLLLASPLTTSPFLVLSLVSLIPRFATCYLSIPHFITCFLFHCWLLQCLCVLLCHLLLNACCWCIIAIIFRYQLPTPSAPYCCFLLIVSLLPCCLRL